MVTNGVGGLVGLLVGNTVLGRVVSNVVAAQPNPPGLVLGSPAWKQQ